VNAFSFAPPWLLMTIPRNPNREAPLYWSGFIWPKRLFRRFCNHFFNNFIHHDVFLLSPVEDLINERKTLITPSIVLRETLPAKPSHTNTSVLPVSNSLPST